jgi:tetratricopeptide (TPR) repeat protein
MIENYKRAKENYKQAINALSNSDIQTLYLAKLYRKLGRTLKQLNENDGARDAYNMATDLLDKLGDDSMIATTIYNEAGHLLNEMKDYHGAFEKLGKGLGRLARLQNENDPSVVAVYNKLIDVRKKLEREEDTPNQ